MDSKTRDRQLKSPIVNIHNVNYYTLNSVFSIRLALVLVIQKMTLMNGEL